MDVLAAMRIFVAVADEGSLTAAAKKLSISKALVSRAVQQLEDHLGSRLLNRTTRKVSLTEIGGDYLIHSRDMLERNGAFEARLSSCAEVPTGMLRISAPISFGLQYISPLIPAFMAEYPEVRVDVSLVDRFVDLVEEGLDVAVRVGSEAPDSAISARLGETRHMLVASPALIARLGEPASPAALEDWPLLEFALKRRPHSWRASQTRPNVALTTNNGDVLVHAALAGLGLVYLPRFIVGRHVEEGTLVPLFPDDVTETNPIVALYPHREFLPLKTRVFVDYLRRALKGLTV